MSTIFAKPLADDYHFQVNNYNNAWLLNVKDLCLANNYCQKNQDNSYNLTLVIENRWGQIIKISFGFSILIIILSLLFLKFIKND